MPNISLRISDVSSMFEFGLPVEGFTSFGLDTYPIFNESHRQILNAKIIDHYWSYEIGHETFSLFHKALNRRMNEIMPLYNQLYESELLKIDPLSTQSLTDVYTSLVEHEANDTNQGTVSSTTDETSSLVGHGESHADTNNYSDGTTRVVNSNFPQSALSGAGDYATSATDSATKATNTTDADTREDSTQQTTGKSTSGHDTRAEGHQTGTDSVSSTRTLSGSVGHSAELLMRWRASFINIDLEVIESLGDLFSGIWDSNEDYTQGLDNGYFGFFRFGPFGL